MVIFIVILIILLLIIAIISPASNSSKKDKLWDKLSTSSPKHVSGKFKPSDVIDIDVPNPMISLPEKFLDFIDRTSSDYLWPVYEQLMEKELLKNLALRKAIYEKARFDIFDREYYDSCFVHSLVNEGYVISEVSYLYKFSFPLHPKDEKTNQFLREVAFVGKNVSLSMNSQNIQVKLINKLLGNVSSEFVNQVEEVLSFEIYAVIEKLPTSGNECIISVNVSELPKYIKSKKEIPLSFEIAGAFVEPRKDYILQNCNEEDDIKFVHEHSNKYDNDAMKIMHKGKKIGYVASRDQSDVNKLLKKGMSAKINTISYAGDWIDVFYIFS